MLITILMIVIVILGIAAIVSSQRMFKAIQKEEREKQAKEKQARKSLAQNSVIRKEFWTKQ